MNSQLYPCRSLVACLAVLTGLLVAGRPSLVPAQSLASQTALKFVPESVSYFSSMLRNREQFDLFVNSKAFQRLQQMPTVQMFVGLARLQWENPQQDGLIQFKDFWDQPENQELLNLLVDGVSREVFVCGDEGMGALLSMMNRINAANQAAQFEQIATGGDRNEILLRKMLEMFEEEFEDFEMPNSLVGFKISTDAQGQQQIARLRKLLETVFEQNAPELTSRLKMEKINGADFLTLRLDGSLIPWDQLPRENLGEAEEQFDKLVEQLKEQPLVIAVGVYQGYLVLSFGGDTEFLAGLGQGKLLASRDEFKPLKKAEGQRVVSIQYVSEDLVENLGGGGKQIDDLLALAEAALPNAPIEEEIRDELLDDLRELANKVKKQLPQPGAVFGYSYLTDQGFEGYTYNWGELNNIDGSKGLSILNHVGGSPILFAAARGVSDPGDYDYFVEVLKRIYYYAEKLGVSQLYEEDRKKFESLREALTPSLAKLDRTTRESFLPGFQDGQVALVLDAKSTSKQWHQALPEATEPLPMLEPAIVLGVSNADLVRKAMGEYFETIQEILDQLHRQQPSDIPEIRLPTPKAREFGNGTVYYYTLPEAVGLDRQVAPAAGLSDSVAVLSPFPLQVKRLLEENQLALSGTVLANAATPRSGASHVSIAALIDAITPWVDYGFTVSQELGEGQANPVLAQVRGQVGTVLSVLRCLGTVTSSMTVQDDVNVTHFEWRMQDLD